MLGFDNLARGVLGAGGLSVVVAALAWGVAVEGTAMAAGAVPIRLEYRAPASCPDEAALVSRIRARVDVRRAQPGEGVPTFGVTLQTDGARVVGRIASMIERSEPTSREVSGTNCSDVVDAVALIVTMALSPTSADNAAARGAAVDPLTAAANGTGAPGSATGSPETSTPSAVTEAAPRFKLLGSGQAEMTLGYVPPSALVAVGARLQLFRASAQLAGPSVAVGFAVSQPVERDISVGRAALSFTTGQLFICPLSVSLAPSLSLHPCGRLDIGQLKAAGSDIANARSASLLWSSAGALGQIAFVPVKPLVIDVQASILFPLTPYKFTFEPDSVIQGAPTVGFSTSLAVGVLFL